MNKARLSPEEQLRYDKKHIRMIALGYAAHTIAEELEITEEEESNYRKRLRYTYGFNDGREMAIYALQGEIITKEELFATLDPGAKVIDWTSVKDL